MITKQIDVTITGTNDAPVITAQDLVGAVTEQATPAVHLPDVAEFSRVLFRSTDVHLVSATGTPVGTTLGSLTAVKNSDTTGSGTGGQLTWTYTVPDSAVEYLRSEERRVGKECRTRGEPNRSEKNKQIDSTINGTNDAQVITA